MNKSTCTFDPETHTYTIEGRRVPNVTEVLNDLLPCHRASEWHLQRGRAVHACAAFVAQGIEFEHDEVIAGQVEACKRFFREVNPVVIDVEKVMYSTTYLFAGTADLICRIGKHTCVLDWKASFSKALPYQLGGYSIEANVPFGVGVQLCDDGKYHMTEFYDMKRYRHGFLALLSAYNIRKQCGATEKKEME